MADRAPTRGRRLALVLAIAAASFAAALLVVEAGLRAMAFTRQLDTPANPAFTPWVVYDPVVGRKNAANFSDDMGLRINSLGFRGDETAVPKPPGTVRIVCVGDSTTFGLYMEKPFDVRLSAAYPVTLAHELREAGYGHVEVVNASVLGYTTSAAIVLLLTKIAAVEPDVVVVRLGNNDHSRVFGEAPQLSTDLEYAVLRHLPRPLFEWETVRLGFHGYRRLLAGTDWAMRGNNVPPDRFERNLHRLLEIAAAIGARVAFLDFPYRDVALGASPGETFPNPLLNATSLEDLHRLHGEYQQTIQRVARETGTPFIHTEAALRASPIPPFSDWDLSHPNEEGARIIGRRVFDELRGLGWLAAAP